MKVAIGLFVKNEAEDIFFWLSWYQQLGIDCVFVGNDGSTDNTEELLKDAKKIFDIRIKNIPASKGLHTERQRDFYREVFTITKGEFDWVGFFDSDEYLWLDEEKNIKKYLSQFNENISQISINWCNYGSSNNIFNRHLSPPYCYVHHSSNDEEINKHVKSFARPEQWSGEWMNPHVFKMLSGSTVSSSGDKILFGDVIGITKNCPDWKSAKILHFQARSLEHFIKRVKNKKNVNFSMATWNSYDFSDIIDRTPQRLAISTIKYVREYMNVTVKRICADLQLIPDGEKKSFPPLGFFSIKSENEKEILEENKRNIDIFRLKSHENIPLHFNGSGVFSESYKGIFDPIFLIVFKGENRCFLMNEKCEYLYIKDECRVSSILLYNVIFDVSDGGIFLSHPYTELFLSCAPVKHGGSVSVHTKIAKGWEKFFIERIENEKDYTDLINSACLSWIKKVSIKSDKEKYLFPLSSDMKFDVLCAILSLIDGFDSEIIKCKLGGAKYFI